MLNELKMAVECERGDIYILKIRNDAGQVVDLRDFYQFGYPQMDEGVDGYFYLGSSLDGPVKRIDPKDVIVIRKSKD